MRRYVLLLLEKVAFPLIMVIVGVVFFEPLRAWWLGPGKYVIYLVGNEANAGTKQLFNTIESDSQPNQLRIDGREIEVHDFDDQGDVARTVGIAKSVSTMPDTLMVVGHVASQSTTNALPIYMRAEPQIPLIATRETDSDLFRLIPDCLKDQSYCPLLPMSPNNEDQAGTALDFTMGENKSRNFLIVKEHSWNADYTDGLATAFGKEITKSGGAIVAELEVDTLASMDTPCDIISKHSTDAILFIGQSSTALNFVKAVTTHKPGPVKNPLILLSDSAYSNDLNTLNTTFYLMSPVSSKKSKVVNKIYGDDAFNLTAYLVSQADSKKLVAKASWLRHMLNMHRVRDARIAITEVMHEHSGGSPYPVGSYRVISNYQLASKHFHIWRYDSADIVDVDKWDQSEKVEEENQDGKSATLFVPSQSFGATQNRSVELVVRESHLIERATFSFSFDGVARSDGSALSPNFRFGPLVRGSYASPVLDTTNLPLEQAPARFPRFRRLVFARLTTPPAVA